MSGLSIELSQLRSSHGYREKQLAQIKNKKNKHPTSLPT